MGMYAIKKITRRYACPVCGYDLEYPPEDFNICPSCGVEFGYETAGRSFFELRQEWIESGAQWASRVDTPPKNWNPWAQMTFARLIFSPPFAMLNVQVRAGKWDETTATVFKPTVNSVVGCLVTR
jgi:hypothetical protein